MALAAPKHLPRLSSGNMTGNKRNNNERHGVLKNKMSAAERRNNPIIVNNETCNGERQNVLKAYRESVIIAYPNQSGLAKI